LAHPQRAKPARGPAATPRALALGWLAESFAGHPETDDSLAACSNLDINFMNGLIWFTRTIHRIFNSVAFGMFSAPSRRASFRCLFVVLA
jgi:hypothetical protein